MAIITSKTRELQTRRPSGPFVVNKASPQFYGLVAWYVGGIQSLTDWNNLVNSQFTLTNSGPTIKFDQTMGRVFSFVGASTQYFSNASAILSTLPITFTSWFNVSDTITAPTLCDVHNSASGNFRDCHMLIAENATDGLHLNVSTGDATSSTFALTTTSYAANTWSHAVGVFASDTDRRVYLNGSGKGTDTTSKIPSGMNTTHIGRRGGTTPGLYLTGAIADTRIYNRVLTDQEVYEQYNPQKRWDLYYIPGRVSYFFQTIAAGSFQPAWGTKATHIVGGAF